MAGSSLMYIVLAFVAGVVFSNKVREMVDPMLSSFPAPFNSVPNFYADSYPATIDYPTTRTSLAGSVYERDYGNANELNINHLPM